MTREEFSKKLKQFVGATRNSMKYARECAEAALRHFAEHGDTVFCQDLLDAMPKNYVRRAAYLKWLTAHAPITMTDGKLAKDKSENAVAFDVEGACKIPFWDYAPDPENVMFSETDVVKSLANVLKRYKTSERFIPLDDAAKAKVEEAERAIEALSA